MIDGARLRRGWGAVFGRLDGTLLVTIVLLLALGLTVLYSASFDTPTRFYDQLRNIAVATVVMWLMAQVPPQTLMRVDGVLQPVEWEAALTAAAEGLQRTIAAHGAPQME